MKYKKIKPEQAQIIITPLIKSGKVSFYEAETVPGSMEEGHHPKAFAETPEQALNALQESLKGINHLMNYDVSDLTQRHFKKPIVMTGSYHTSLQVKLLHDKLDHALMILCGSQQNGGMGTEFNEDEDNQASEEIRNIVNDIKAALVYPDFDLDREMDNYLNSSKRIFEYFGCQYSWVDISYHPKSYWNIHGGQILWTPESEYEESHDDFLYSGVVFRTSVADSKYERDNHVLILADFQTGDGMCACIFDKNYKKIM